jgi:hypothetical protein
MNKRQYFEGFSEEKQKQYEQEIRARYGEKAIEGVPDWNSYTPEQKAAIQAESEAIYADLAEILETAGKGGAQLKLSADSPEIQKAQPIIARWRQHLCYFYEPSGERLRGLGQLYCEHPDFRATFTKIHPALPECMKLAIEVYCLNL